jgi:hypothetical protein
MLHGYFVLTCTYCDVYTLARQRLGKHASTTESLFLCGPPRDRCYAMVLQTRLEQYGTTENDILSGVTQGQLPQGLS